MQQPPDAPDTGPAIISDHPFTPPEHEPWGLCTVGKCRLGRAAHKDGPTYVSTAKPAVNPHQ